MQDCKHHGNKNTSTDGENIVHSCTVPGTAGSRLAPCTRRSSIITAARYRYSAKFYVSTIGIVCTRGIHDTVLVVATARAGKDDSYQISSGSNIGLIPNTSCFWPK